MIAADQEARVLRLYHAEKWRVAHPRLPHPLLLRSWQLIPTTPGVCCPFAVSF
jgi:hypothetical protein